MRKGEQLKQEAIEPFGVPPEVDLSGFDLGRLRRHPLSLAALWFQADRAVHAGRCIALQVLQERHAGAGFLDQDGFGTVLGGQAGNLAPEIGVLEPAAEHIDQVKIRLDDTPSGAHGKVIGLARHHGDIPALHDSRAWILRWQLVVIFEPLAPDEIAFERHRPLLVLGREHQAADLGLDLVKHCLALPGRMQDVAGAPRVEFAWPCRNDAVFDGDCWQVKTLPAALAKEMTGKVVLVQALHHHHDGISVLVVEPRHQGPAVPVDHPLAGRVRHRLLALEGIVDDDEVGAAPRQSAADRGRVAAAAGGGDELGAGIFCRTHGREESPIPRRIDDHSELAMQFGGQLGRIAHDDNSARRIVTHKPCDKGD